MQVTTIAADDGTIGVFAAGGQRLVLGTEVQKLTVVPDAADSSRSAIAINDNGLVRALDQSVFTGGSIAGLLRFQNDDLVDARNLLGQMATALTEQVNQAQANGLDLRVPAGSGAPIFSIGAPQAIAATSNTRAPDGSYASSVAIAVVDATAVQASDYELRPDPAGAPGVYQLTRLSDGMVSSVASGDVIDGMRIDVGTPAPAPSDRFLLQPVGNAASTMQQVLDDPRGLAAASPLSATMGVANTGTASVAALTVDGASANPELTAAIAFTSDSGDYTWELRDRTSNAVVSSGTATWTAGQPIELNGFSLQLNGVPEAGDSVDVSKTLQPATNNGNALAMMGLRDAKLVGVSASFAGSTLTDAYASAMADVGVRAQSANLSASMSTAAQNPGRWRARCAHRRQPRRRGGPPDPVPAELPGRGQGAAGRAVAVRHHAADQRPLIRRRRKRNLTMTRVVTGFSYQSSIATLQARQSDMAEAQQHMTTGLRVLRASDDPTAAARAERARATLQRNEVGERAVDASRSSMQQTESALADGNELLQQARELIVSAGNASYGDAERLSIANQLQGLRDQLLGVANRSDGAGGYLFSGQGSSGAPFLDAPGGVVFAGTAGTRISSSDEALPLGMDGSGAWLSGRSGNGIFETRNSNSSGAWIDAGVVTQPADITGANYSISFADSGSGPTFTVLRDGQPTALAGAAFTSGQAIEIDGMSVTITGTPADGDSFEIAPSTPDMSPFAALDAAIAALETPHLTSTQVTQAVQGGLRDVDGAMTQLQGARSRAGEALNRIDLAETRLSASTLAAESDRSSAEDIDMVKAISDFQTQQTSYSAALQSYATVQKMSLFDYLRT
jgi:flagellar hook-associated protein 3